VGFLLLALGTVIAFLPDRAYALAGAQTGKVDRDKAAAIATLLVLLLAGGLARAQEAPAPAPPTHSQRAGANGPHYTRSPRETKLFQQIVCQCGTCGRQVLSECSCSTASEMRGKIQALLDAGKSDDDVIAYELATYPGQSALVVPLDKGFNRLAWVLPYGAILLAMGGLVVTARRWTRRPLAVAHAEAAPRPETAEGATASERAPAGVDSDDAKYEARLDDALDELD
jgi:cytochrome c-type biogenesis protein CcmH/NrfF